MSRYALRFFALVVVGFAVAVPGSSASIAAEARPAAQVSASATCCTVTYNAAKTHFQVTGTVSYKGTDVPRFTLHGYCASSAGNGRASVKSRWIPLRENVAGYQWFTIIQRVNGKIVFSKSPRFYVKGTAQLRKPAARITSGPSGVVTGTSALFKFTVANAEKTLCRLDSQSWEPCLRWKQYENLELGPHVFKVRAHAFGGGSFADATRSFTLSAPKPE